jgi:choline kinase
MVHSLFCAEDELDGEIIISYADILYERAVLDAMLRAQDQDVSVAADTEWEDYYRERFSRPLEEAESFLWNSDRKILEIGASHPSRENVQAQYIGLIRLSAAATTHIRNFYSAARARYWDREWLRGRIFQKTYMTDFLQGLIDSGVGVYGVPIHHGWLEFDTAHDYEMVLEWRRAGVLSRFCALDSDAQS